MQATINTTLDVISVNVWAILASLANLLIIAWIVKRFLFKPVKKIVDARRAAIDADYEQAAAARAEAEEYIAEALEQKKAGAIRFLIVAGCAVVSDGKDLLLNSLSAGDEPYMLATNLKDVVVLVDKDRVKSGLYAIEEYHTDTLILDDGFQYLGLRPHLNILLVDSTCPFGNHHVLPR